MFHQTCDKQVTVGLTSIHNFIHSRSFSRRSAAVSQTSRSNVAHQPACKLRDPVVYRALLRLGFTTAALRRMGCALSLNLFELSTIQK